MISSVKKGMIAMQPQPCGCDAHLQEAEENCKMPSDYNDNKTQN